MQTKLFFQSLESLWTKYSKWQSSLGVKIIEWWKYTTNFKCCSIRSHFSAINLNSFPFTFWWAKLRLDEKIESCYGHRTESVCKNIRFQFQRIDRKTGNSPTLLHSCWHSRKKIFLEEICTAILKCFQWLNFPCCPGR